MSRSSKFLELVEEVINPESSYISDSKEGTTTSKTHSKLKSEAQRHLKKAPNLEGAKNSAYEYSKNAYSDVNHHLRNNVPLEEWSNGNVIRHLKGLTNNPTEHEFYAYRGVTKDTHPHVQEGDIIHDQGFTSTSLRSSTAGKFSRGSKKAGLFRIHVTPGVKGHYISGHDRIKPDEREFVLHPGTKFRVGKTVKHPSGRTFTELHIHSQED